MMEMDRRNERCLTFKLKFGPVRLNFNPVVTISSAIVIWGFVAWCVIDPTGANEEMGEIKKWITGTFTWFYIGAVNVLIIFLIYLYFSKFSELKLGKDDEKPEFSDGTYFTMLFAAGIGIGLFYFSVTEPLSHYQPKNKYGNRYWGRVHPKVASCCTISWCAENLLVVKSNDTNHAYLMSLNNVDDSLKKWQWHTAFAKSVNIKGKMTQLNKKIK